MRTKPAAFPVGLYGMLLLALCWLTLPSVFAPLERWFVGSACLVPRMVARITGAPAAAAKPRELARLRQLGDDLRRRVRLHDEAGARAVFGARLEPVFCAVLEAREEARRGGGGQPCELRLDRSYADLAGCSEFVTKGPALIGFLQRAGVGVAADDKPEDPARVVLLNHRAARPSYAAMSLPEGEVLRLVVGAAASVDPAPLRADLWDDPYRAARLDRGGLAVHTLALSHEVGNQVPDGLLLGHTRIWGYEREDGGDALTIGVFVVPPFEPRALSHVVVWRPVSTSGAADAAVTAPSALTTAVMHRYPTTVYDLPGAVYGRHLLVTGRAVPDGAAVVQDGLFLGTVRGLAFGAGLVTAFAASRQRWSLVLLPDDAAEPPQELVGQVVRTSRNVAWLRWRSGGVGSDVQRLSAGYLFTGSNGAHCPAGLWIGRASPDPFERDLLQVTTPVEPGPRSAQVLVRGEAR
ncbi:MAG: hypothetical protein ABIP94_13325 [Planctomycetota bacterium]